MKVTGRYDRDGYAFVEGLVAREIAHAFLSMVREAIGPGAIPLSRVTAFPNLLQRPALEIYGFKFPPMLPLLWGLTPIVSELIGRELLPTYDYFRVYRGGDQCRVHFDRPSCEHSLSLTLGYSDDKLWPLMVGHERFDQPNASVEEHFGEEQFSALPMQVGDGVLYRGTNHRHGRITPNPNRWSAHLFLHWVERGGPYEAHSFDGRAKVARPDFEFA